MLLETWSCLESSRLSTLESRGSRGNSRALEALELTLEARSSGALEALEAALESSCGWALEARCSLTLEALETSLESLLSQDGSMSSCGKPVSSSKMVHGAHGHPVEGDLM